MQGRSKKQLHFFMLLCVLGIVFAVNEKTGHDNIGAGQQTSVSHKSGTIAYETNEVLDKDILLTDEKNELDMIQNEEVTDKIVSTTEQDCIHQFDYSWTEMVPPLVAHALGGINNNTYTNSLEAFLYNYEQGHRVFEVDFFITDPEKTLVAAHSDSHWRRQISTNRFPIKRDFTYSNFMNQKIYGKYTTMDYRDIIGLMITYPDIFIITDSKFTDKDSVLLQFKQLIDYANEMDPTVLNRLIPQIYSEEMLDWVMDLHPFGSVIFTVYQTDWTIQSVYDFFKKSHVKFITVPCEEVTQEMMDVWGELEIIVACHTCNDQEQARSLFEMGLDFIYTDFLKPGILSKG